ncbi:blue copper protein 1a-like [Miscanthus floridulus]|uniref:blue copper protein 1a-like n=1 Tax=Miscanthus floridulus TaxID=154761 RepID=UPI00345A9908
MASKQMLLLAVAVAFLPALDAATEHWVGDDKGWTLGFNYTAWAQTKQFKVGDTLVFKYNKSSHTVVEVSGADFAACSTPEAAKVLATGRDQVALDSPGRRWFVCSIGAHCLNGMKVRIDVLAADDNSPVAPPPSGPASNVQARLALAVLAVAAVLVL